MNVFMQLETDLDETIKGLVFEFEQLKVDSRTKDYRKYLKKLKTVQGQMKGL